MMEIKFTQTKEKYLDTINKYKDTVYKVAYTYCGNHADADDIFQEVFLSYFKKIPDFHSEEHEKAWFIKVTINCCKNLLSSAWFKKTVALDENISFEDEADNGIFHVVMSLPQKYRVVVQLYYYEDYSIREISEMIAIKETTIQTRLQRARNILARELKEDKYGQQSI